jgi:hypothetical protein
MLAGEGKDLRSLFYDIHRTVMKAMERSGYSLKRTLKILGISRSWYYSQMDFSPILDGRFNPMAIRSDDEWIVIGFRNEHPECHSGRLRTLSWMRILHIFPPLQSTGYLRSMIS